VLEAELEMQTMRLKDICEKKTHGDRLKTISPIVSFCGICLVQVISRAAYELEGNVHAILTLE